MKNTVTFNVRISLNGVLLRIFVDETAVTKVDVNLSRLSDEKVKATHFKHPIMADIRVTLEGTDYTPVTGPKMGGYTVIVTPYPFAERPVDDGPAAVFCVNKYSTDVDARIMKLMSIKGLDSDETIEIRWSANQKLEIRKTGPKFNGVYGVDFKLRTSMDEVIQHQITTLQSRVERLEKQLEKQPAEPTKRGWFW